MAMEHEVTGLYLSGHPMDAYAGAVRRIGAVAIGRILSDYAVENGPLEFSDGRQVTLAGVISAAKTKTTKNNSLMAYITLEAGTGSLELLAFQRTLDTGGMYVKENLPVYITGKISARDDQPQLLADSIRPLSDLDPMPGETVSEEKTLHVRITDKDDPAMERLKLILTMFPGREQLVVHFAAEKKRQRLSCVIHEALVRELEELLGADNVVVK
jgi:DNA polymerase-3 subunit alpha